MGSRLEHRGAITFLYHTERRHSARCTAPCTEQQNQTYTATLVLIVLRITDSPPIARHANNNAANDKARACAINTAKSTQPEPRVAITVLSTHLRKPSYTMQCRPG